MSVGEAATGTGLEVQAAPGGEGIAIASLVELGSAPLIDRTDGGSGWRLLGQDGGQTIDLGDEVLFTFADTLIQPAAGNGADGSRAGQVLLANCAARARPGAGGLPRALAELRYLEDARGRPRQILSPTAEERRRRMRLWPAHGLATGGRVYLFYLGIEFVNPSSDWGFRNLGAGLAALDPATGEAVRLQRRGDWCLWRSHGDDFHFGVQVLREGDLAYVYSSVRHGYFSEAGVARVPVAQIGEPAAYTFLAEDGSWTPRHAEAASLGPASNDYSVSWNAHLGRYLMTFVDPYAKVLHLRTAPHPWGPWSAPQPVAALPHQPGSELIFLGFEHPRFAADGGRTVHITYCQPHFVQNTVLALTFA